MLQPAWNRSRRQRRANGSPPKRWVFFPLQNGEAKVVDMVTRLESIEGQPLADPVWREKRERKIAIYRSILDQSTQGFTAEKVFAEVLESGAVSGPLLPSLRAAVGNVLAYLVSTEYYGKVYTVPEEIVDAR